MRRLKDATGACTSSTTADDEAVIGNIAHTNLHYGDMITINSHVHHSEYPMPPAQ